ncbi:hypothetical protein BDY19DRAFT_985785 [Irpex rosettiformis]|uniref:Uncharacterized protein n=1 Tax=Irpex rosettiformis TaxID=378272 RepID=A0ACB8U158_9APHY|nr:hypothetical protein BDY19DRAFT_985785 [Irpex rosettiformis]
MPPPPKPPPPHKLELTTNSLRNTTMSAENDSFHYEIVTRFWHPHLTKINKADLENLVVTTVAEIERIPGREPRVRFGGEKGEWILASDFVQFDEGRTGGTFVGTANVKYRWRTQKGRLELVKADDEDQSPVAEFHPHSRHFFVFRMSKHAFFEIKPIPEVTGALEKVIASYLIVERRRRQSRISIKIQRR